MNWLTYSNRYEIKYLVDSHRLPEIERALEGFLMPDENGKRTNGYFNYSIYFDSPHYQFYSEKREGDLVRIKPRIRLYRPALDAPPKAVFMELKGRYDRIVTKRRTPIDAEFAQQLLTTHPIVLDDRAVESPAMGEFYYLAHRFRLAPCVTVLYHRTAYYGAFYPGVRVTFDRVIRGSRMTTLNNPEDSFIGIIPTNQAVIELKYNDKVPEMLLGRFRSLGLQHTTFSKFAVALERTHDEILRHKFLAA